MATKTSITPVAGREYALSEDRPPKPPQTIRGGYIVLRRDGMKHRLTLIGGRPYEHGSLDEAMAQAAVLANRLGAEIAVFAQVATVLPDAVEIPAAPTQALAPAPLPTPVPVSRPVIVEHRKKRSPRPVITTQGGLS